MPLVNARKGESMQNGTFDAGRVYGYTVCLVATLIFVFASVEMTGGILDLREPPYTETYRNGPTLVSVDAYRMDVLARGGFAGDEDSRTDLLPTDAAWREMYEAERMYRLALTHQTGRRTIMVSLVLQVVAVLLFIGHWSWLRSRERPSSPGGG